MSKVIPIQGIPALLLGLSEKTVCIADLHLGYELELRESGFNIPDQTSRIAKSIISIEEGDNLIILGDVKHTIPFATRFESVRLPKFFESLQERFSSITIITGNHDGALKKSLPKDVNLISARGLSISSIGLTHGHSWPSNEVMKSKILLMGHIHPSLKLKDRLGARTSIKCWLKGRLRKKPLLERYREIGVSEVVIMPAYNPLLVGTAVNEDSNDSLSPLLRSGAITLKEQLVYTIDGVCLGRVSDLLLR